MDSVSWVPGLMTRPRNGEWRRLIGCVAMLTSLPFSTIGTLLALQHPEGGFAGGPGQAAHLLPTYAAVCAFAVVGHPGEGGGWDSIDRYAHYSPRP